MKNKPAVEPLPQKPEEYQVYYTEHAFWDKLAKYALAAGHKLVTQALELYYTATSKDTPLWAKTLIFGALGYFILPIDAIPDILPVIGYTDDLATLAGAVAAVTAFIKPEYRQLAQTTLQQWFREREKKARETAE